MVPPGRPAELRIAFLSSLPLQLLRQSQESEAIGLRSLQKVQGDRRLFQERASSLQRALAQLENEKREAERSSLRLEKDRNALRKTLDKASPSGSEQKGGQGPVRWAGGLSELAFLLKEQLEHAQSAFL